MFRPFAIVAVAALAACDTGTDTGDTDDSGELPPIEFSVAVKASEVELTITNGLTGGYDFGMAETGCPDPANCWYGEDCLNGTAGYNYCHTAQAQGVVLSGVADPDDVVAGSTTLLVTSNNDVSASAITFYVHENATDSCWVWGHDPSYYSSLGCQEI